MLKPFFFFPRHPEWQKKLEEELKEFCLLDNADSPVTTNVIQQMRYLQAFVNEVLRLHPPVGAVYRKAKKTLQVGVH